MIVQMNGDLKIKCDEAIDTAYQRGLEDGKKSIWDDAYQTGYDDAKFQNDFPAYQKGLEDAWEFMYKLWMMDSKEFCKAFNPMYDDIGNYYDIGGCDMEYIFRNLTAQEAMQKIKDYGKGEPNDNT